VKGSDPGCGLYRNSGASNPKLTFDAPLLIKNYPIFGAAIQAAERSESAGILLHLFIQSIKRT
jgi:hypothetical protein